MILCLRLAEEWAFLQGRTAVQSGLVLSMDTPIRLALNIVYAMSVEALSSDEDREDFFEMMDMTWEDLKIRIEREQQAEQARRRRIAGKAVN